MTRRSIFWTLFPAALMLAWALGWYLAEVTS